MFSMGYANPNHEFNFSSSQVQGHELHCALHSSAEILSTPTSIATALPITDHLVHI
jgi:hypothetical protein